MPSGEATYDVAVIGGGIVGLATAMALTASPGRSVIVLEAENRLADHQTGHNSGVIHSGLYYKPGSLKARLCTEGRRALYEFCRDRGIAHEACGKVVVATDDSELPALTALEERGRANGLSGLRRLSAAELHEHEPNVQGVAGLLVGETGIVDYRQVAEAYAGAVRGGGGSIQTGCRVRRVTSARRHLRVETTSGDVACRCLINCCGLQSDRVAKLCGARPSLRILPFRGEYYELVASRRHLVRNLIYPVPDPRFPFLGVHFTRMINGGVEAGPNAVLAFKREGYTRWSFSMRDMLGLGLFPGSWRMARKYWRTGLGEFHRSFSKRAFVRALRKLLPAIEGDDLLEAGAGVRAQAVEPSGALVDDFRIIESERMVHVLNAPSPAATASISIGRYIADVASKHL